MHDIEKLEATLWEAADNLRANSHKSSSEYCMPVLGVIFLRHATNRYDAACREIAQDQAAGRMPRRPLNKADFLKRRALMLPKQARYGEIVRLPTGADFGAALVAAMNAIEREFEPLLNQLPKDYGEFESSVLENLLRIFDSETLRTSGGDVFGRIYEYFLMKFAMQGAQDNGEFFTPPSLVQTIVNVIEPDHGIVFDPACGSGGMFVQSSHFIERQNLDTAHRVTFFGHEKTITTIRLARMNLAVHGLQGDIRDANTYYEDPHRLQDGKPLWGHCDFVMANPPFNVDEVDAGKVGKDRRFPFGLPGVNKNKKVSNGNYLWISYFHSYLAPKGRAGFVMSSQASSAGHTEAEVRRKLIQTGDVDVMISIRSNFFYTRTVPCELWHLDRGKPADRRDQVLMIDARNVYRKVTRKIYDFSPEQLQNLTAIVWLYRGQRDRFLDLVQTYLDRTLRESAAIAPRLAALRAAHSALVEATAPFLTTLPAASPIRHLATDRDTAVALVGQPILAADPLSSGSRRAAARPLVGHALACPAEALLPAKAASKARPSLTAQKKLLATLALHAAACRTLIKDIDLACKLSLRVVDAAEKDASARDHASWDTRAIARLAKDLDARRQDAVDQLKLTAYFERQADWLLSRFTDAEFTPVPGLCRAVTLADIEAADWSLSPGLYVGVAPQEVNEDFDFEQTLRDIHTELEDLNREAAELAARIQENFEGLGV
jgi:type I restriction enzyme M protein